MKNETISELNQSRKELNALINESDSFFSMFGTLDDKVYADGAIPKKYKELTGLSISVLTHCEECIAYHLQNCLDEGCSRVELLDAIKMGVIGGGSITYPSVRFAYKLMKELNI